jgi:phosphoglycerate dehydrogenase-like enzyme
MPNIGIVGTFAASLEDAIRRDLTIPCEIAVSDEAGIMPRLADLDVLVTMVLTDEMGRACTHLKLVQVPGAGLDRIDRAAIPSGTWLANVYGHEDGIAEYVMGAMIALTRDLVRLDVALRKGDWQSQWAIGVAPPPVWPELAGKTIGILGYGRIGRAVAQRARAFDMKICAVRQRRSAFHRGQSSLPRRSRIDR